MSVVTILCDLLNFNCHQLQCNDELKCKNYTKVDKCQSSNFNCITLISRQHKIIKHKLLHVATSIYTHLIKQIIAIKNTKNVDQKTNATRIDQNMKWLFNSDKMAVV